MTASEPSLDRVLHAIADPTRRRILQTLKERGACTGAKGSGVKVAKPRDLTRKDPITKRASLCAGDIETCVRLSQPTISHHMAILTKAGLVEAVKRGQWRWYRRNDKAIRQIVKLLRNDL
ncbi:MAG TPA: metalloregulator ArsR/SmtB family transcription factor [Candidatus Sulfotelmatobacter sp.]|nr:metalloregulator ArsR/SmtB family transcription factor [Candidatus Sulfotelmatobacter sp.]